MSFLNEIQKASSEKYSLVRIEFTRLVEVSSIGGNYYQANLDIDVSKCFIGKKRLTQVFTGLPTSNQYTFVNGLLTTYSTTLLESVVVKHYVYLSVGKNRAIGKDPTNPNQNLVEWRGVLTKEPELDEDLTNINSGVLTVSTSSIEIFNHSGEFDFLFSRIDGVYNSSFDVWFCCNGEIQFAFSGIIIAASQSNKIISLRTANPIEKLNSICTLAYNQNKAYVNEVIFPSACPSHIGNEIPVMLGKISDYKAKYSGIPSARSIDAQSLRPASCAYFNQNITTSTNREWILARNFSYSPIMESVSFYAAGNYFTVYASSSTVASHFSEFDYFRLGNDVILEVINVSGNIINARKISGTTPNSPATMRFNFVPVAYLIADDVEYRLSPLNYTIFNNIGYDESLGLLSIILDDDIESIIGLSRAIDPNSDQIKFRMTSSNSNYHGHFNIAQILLGYSGINTSVTIDPTQEKVSFMLPFINETYGSYIDALERLCQSNATYVFQKLDGNYSYDFFNSPSNGYGIEEQDVINGSYAVEEIGQDVCSRLVLEKVCNDFTNDIILNSDEIESIIGGATEKTIKFVNLSNAPRNELILQNMLKTNRHSFKLKNLGYDWTIGKSIRLFGKDLTVIKINKSLPAIEITAVDTFKQWGFKW